MDLYLWCIVRGEDDIFHVVISKNDTVSELKERVQAKLPCTLGDFEASKLTLYKPKSPMSASPEEGLGARVQSDYHLSDLQKLEPICPLSTYFPGELDMTQLHIIVERPPIHRNKRLKLESVQLRLSNNTLARLAPSKFDSHEMKRLQDDEEQRILNDRPQCDKDWAPIKLMFSGFGVFHDIVTQKLLSEEHDDWIDDGAFFEALSDYRAAASRTYSDENQKRDHSMAHLNKLYSSLRTRRGRSIAAANVIDNVRTDGHTLGPHNVIDFVQELRLELGSKGAVPEVQVASYFMQSFKVEAMKPNTHMLFNTRVPAVALIAYGSVVQFFGMVMLGTRLRMMPLWHPVDIRIVAGDDMDEEVIWLFKAAIVLDGLIYRELETIANNTPSTTATLTTDIHFPAVNEAARYRDGISAGTTLKFELEARIVSSDPHRFLYLAHDPLANCCVIVKFARSYSFELHTYLERKKRAPRLFGFQRLPGGWFVVVMEYLEKFDPLQLQVEDGAAFTSELEGELLALVHEMHDQNLVHGDLREANILVPREGTADELNRPFVIVDFDWGGEIGRAKFPDVRLNPHICVGDKRTRLVQRTDDTKTLSGMFERLRGVQSGM